MIWRPKQNPLFKPIIFSSGLKGYYEDLPLYHYRLGTWKKYKRQGKLIVIHTYNRIEKCSKKNTKSLWDKDTHEAHQNHHDEPVPFQRLAWHEVWYRDVHETEEQLKKSQDLKLDIKSSAVFMALDYYLPCISQFSNSQCKET